MRLRSRYGLYLRTVVDERDGSWVRRYSRWARRRIGASVDGCGGGWRVMDRDAHMDRQWVCGVYSQLEGFSNAQNALSLRWLLSQAVQRAYMTFPRFPWSPHLYLRCARFLRRVCVPKAVPRRVRVRNPEKKWGVFGAYNAPHARNAGIFFPNAR
jgi:hypothetical protein